MPNIIDLTGQRFGRLTVVRFQGRQNEQTFWLCQCDCGKTTKTSTSRLRSGQTKSCGCYNLEMSRVKNTKHGQSKSRLYRIWRDMIGRCRSKKNKRYGGRGIKVCDEWENSFESFACWAIQNGYSDELTIDRKDNNKNYSPDNCKWSTAKEQANNRSNNHVCTINGVSKTLTEWAEQFNINYAIIRDRINELGWDVEEAITTPKLPYWNTRRKHE